MATPGLRLIQDLLAKSVAKWSGEAVKTAEDENDKSIKIEENNIKVEYTENLIDALDTEKEQGKMKKKKAKEMLKRKLIEAETVKNVKRKKKAHTMSKYGVCETEFKKKVDNNEPDLKDDKSFITKLLESSAANYTSDGYDVKVSKTNKLEKIQRRKLKLCKEEIDMKTEIIDNIKKEKDDLVSADVLNSLSYPELKTHGDDNDRHGLTGLKKKTRVNLNLKSIVSKDTDNAIKVEQKMCRKAQKKTNYKRKPFSPEEDEILQHAIDTDNVCYKRLAEQLGRNRGAIQIRVERLKIGDRRSVRREYSLMEDLLIMDRMLEKLPGKRLKDLEMLADDDSSKFVTSLGRTRFSSIACRWSNQLKPWILQYYTGTLNLDIKRQLANFIADTFTGFDSIDWSVVGDRPEFVGHTLTSLKRLFYDNLFKSTKNLQNLEPSEVTLRNVVDVANMECGLKKKVTPRVLTRQMK